MERAMTTKPAKTNISGDSPQPRRKGLNLVPADQRHGLGGKVIGYANAGPRVRVGISLPDCRHHIYVCGPTGTGKTVLLENVILDDVEAGRVAAAWSSWTRTKPRRHRRSTCSTPPHMAGARTTWPRTSPP